MPHRSHTSKELGKLLSVISHPHRIRIIEELRDSERDVNSLQAALGLAHSAVSQHLSLLRSHRLVEERKEGRHVFYRLSQPAIAQWLLTGLDFLESSISQAAELRSAIEETRTDWSTSPTPKNPIS